MSPEEVAAAVAEIRERVRDRHAKTVPEISGFELPVLEPLGHARDRADGKTAAIGTVNPRPKGLLNDAIQAFKQLVARSLNWLVRDQIEFNRATIAYMDRNIEAMVEQNYNILRAARELVQFRADMVARFDETASRFDARLAAAQAQIEAHGVRLDELARDQADALKHWNEWKPAFEARVDTAEIRTLHAIRDLEMRARDREEDLKRLHADYLRALERATSELQQAFWGDLAKIQADHERQIHAELRVLRRKPAAPAEATTAAATPAPSPQQPSQETASVVGSTFDYTRFEERFRGNETFVSQNMEFYLPYFEKAGRVLDLGCGRGEFLKLLAERGVSVQGVDLDAEALAAAREKGLDVVEGDLFEYLRAQPEGACGGILCAHVVEHLPWNRVPELMELASRALKPDGLIAFETPNPACLAIFAGDFYLDPTHQKPVPSAQLDFHLREAGFGRIEVHERRPAPEVYPELAKLDEIEGLAGFRKRFFGGLDYAILARKIAL